MHIVWFQFETFLNQINSSLVDSNMLVRCIVLSLDRFEGQTEDMKGANEVYKLINCSQCIACCSYTNCVPFRSDRGAVRVSSVVLHGSSGEQALLPLQADQHHQCADAHSGKTIIFLWFLVSSCKKSLWEKYLLDEFIHLSPFHRFPVSRQWHLTLDGFSLICHLSVNYLNSV